jgi:iron complex outermembrane receptor protein
MQQHRITCLLAAISLLFPISAYSFRVDIAAGLPLSEALEAVTRTADVQLLYVPDQVATHRSTALQGNYTIETALTELLAESNLEFLFQGDTVVIKRLRKPAASQRKTALPPRPYSRHKVIEEVLVTARKRIEFSQDVPITLNVIQGELLHSLNIQDTDDIESYYSNLTTNTRSVVSSGVAIRGVGTNNIHVSAQQSVGINVNDIAAVSPFVSVISLFDLERVEVLRGPQNTLYGRNTIGGVINYHTKAANPYDDFNGSVALKAGNGGFSEFEGAIGFPITQNLAARIAAVDRSFDGLWTNQVDGKDYGAKANQAARINVVWDASKKTSMSFTLATAEGDGDNSIRRQVGNLSSDGISTCPAFEAGEPSWISGVHNCWSHISSAMISDSAYLSNQLDAANTQLLIANPNFVGNGGTNTQYDYLVNYSTKWGDTYQHPSGGYNTDYDNMRLKLVHDFQAAQLTWLSAFNSFYIKSINNNGLSGFTVVNEGEWDVLQQELRLTSNGNSGFNWLAGLYYNEHTSQEDTWVVRSEFARSSAMIIDSNYKAWSAYGELDFELNDDWSVILGGRYTNDVLEGDARKSVCTQAHGVGFGLDNSEAYDRSYRENRACTPLPLVDSTPTQKLSETGWKLGLNWSPVSNALLYASASKGFKGGAYDNRALANGEQPIDPEFLLAYELGVKSEWFDNTLQINAAMYLYDWEDLQVFATAPDGNPHLLNIPRTELKGLELEAKWSPTELLYLQMGLSVSDNKIVKLTDFQRSVTQWETGFEITNAPDVTANLLIENRIPMGAGELILRGSYRYMSDYFYFTASPDQDRSQSGGHDWLKGQISYHFGDQLQHSVALWGDNLTGEKSIAALSLSIPGNINFPGQVEGTGFTTWGITLESQF